MAGSAKRERQLAREHYERQQARRAAQAGRRKRTQQVVAVVLAALALVAGVVVLATQLGGEDTVRAADSKKTGSQSAEASTSPSPSAAGCTYSKSGQAAKDVGVPLYDPRLGNTYREPFSVGLATNRGPIRIAMDAAEAPCTTNSFRHLVEAKYFDDTKCHRLTTANIFVLQCGDPTGTGSGGPGYQFGEENLPADGDHNYPAGTVAMANAGSGTNGSQFFLVYKDTTLPPNYTIFGHITSGLDLVRQVAKAGSDNANGQGDGHPKMPVTIETASVGRV